MHGRLAGEIMAMSTDGLAVKVTRDMVEAILDFHISLEGTPRTALDNDLEFEDLQVRYKEVIEHGRVILRNFASQFDGFDALQVAFYSFTNSDKYQRSIVTLSVARTVLNSSWQDINGWRS